MELGGQGPRWTYGLAIAALLIAAAVRIATFGDHGISWDEAFRLESGARKTEYLGQVITGERAAGNLPAVLREDSYPGLFDMTTWELARRLGTDPFATLHACVQIWGLSALVAVWLIGWRLGGAWTGLAALLFLATVPRFWGHAAFNPKDIPFLTGYAWSLFWLLEAARPLPRVAIGRWLVAGLSAGLCAGTRLAGLVFVLYALAILVASTIWTTRWARRGRGGAAWRPFLPVAEHLVAGVGFASLAVLAVWPVFPPMHLGGAALLENLGGPHWVGRVLFEGTQQLAGSLPAYYLPKWLLITMPEGLLLALLAGLPAAWRGLRRPAPGRFRRAAPYGLLVLAFVFPAWYSMQMGRSQYDGVRHGLFLLVPLVCLAAAGLAAAVRGARRPAVARGLLVAVGASLLLNLGHLWSLHPYQYVYFNAFVGYLPGADGRYEKDYWGLSLREAVDRLEAELADVPDPPPIASMRPEFLTENYLRTSRLEYSPGGVDSPDAGYLVVLDRWEQPAVAARFGEPVPELAVRRQGVELCRVLRRPGSR